jgi:DNA-binding NarL/FixJ family response regulator
VKLLAEGLSAKEIAARLSLSTKTVDVHKTNLMRKLDVHGRADLTRWAIRNKVIRLPVLK